MCAHTYFHLKFSLEYHSILYICWISKPQMLVLFLIGFLCSASEFLTITWFILWFNPLLWNLIRVEAGTSIQTNLMQALPGPVVPLSTSGSFQCWKRTPSPGLALRLFPCRLFKRAVNIFAITLHHITFVSYYFWNKETGRIQYIFPLGEITKCNAGHRKLFFLHAAKLTRNITASQHLLYA